MNNQKPEPISRSDGEALDVHSIFFTLQGEGPFTGHRSIFLRLAGCNLQCPGCDTEYTEGRAFFSKLQLVETIRSIASHNNASKCLVVITGGEPTRQTIGPLVNLLRDNGHPVQIESNGVLAPDSELAHAALYDRNVTLVVSPKTNRINKAAAEVAKVFKYVLDHRYVDPVDGLPTKALEHPTGKFNLARPPHTFTGPIYLNPYDAGNVLDNRYNLEAAARSALKHGYILGVQLHKLVGLE